MTYELSTCILKMILLYIVILSSVTIQTVKSQGDKDCDCKGFGLVKDLVLQVVMEQRMESAKLSRLEARLKTYETTWPILNDRLKGLEKNLNDINMKFNETVTGTKDKQMGFNRGIGTIVQKALISEKKERKKLVSSMNKIVNEYKDTIETFKEAINNTIDKRFQDISAEQVKYKDTVETFKVAINKTIDKRFQDITAKQADYKATIETYKEAIDNTIDNRFQDITAKQVDYKATIETYKEAINNTIDNRFQDIAAEQREYKNTLETFKVSINKTIDERFEHISANQIKYRNEISLDLITINETRYMVDTLGKIVEGGQVRLVNGSYQYEGRLEVWHDWSWGTVCGDGFDTLSASVVCKMLNFQHTFPRVYGSAQFGAGASLIHLDNVDCKGTETSITQCRHNGWGINDCEHREDVGISCTPGKMYMISTKTGTRTGAGTDANVNITLFGSKGSTRRIDLRGKFESGDVDEIRTFARDVRPIHSVQIGHDGGRWHDILSDWDLEYVSIYVEHMEEFYVFRNIKQQWVKKENDLTLHREGNQSCINTFGEKYMWYPTWKKINGFFLGKRSGMSSRACKQACINWRKNVCSGVFRQTEFRSCHGFSETRDEYFTVKNEPWTGELFFRTCKKFT